MSKVPCDVHRDLLGALDSMRDQTQSLIVSELKSENGPSAERYSLELSLNEKSIWPDLYPSLVHFDASQALVLRYRPRCGATESIPVACTAFDFMGTRPSLLMPPFHFFIRQIQAIPLDPKEVTEEDHRIAIQEAIGALRWRKLLVKTMIMLARSLDYVQDIRIMRGCDCNYYFALPGQPKFAERNARIKGTYDGVARACKFVLDNEKRAHILAIH